MSVRTGASRATASARQGDEVTVGSGVGFPLPLPLPLPTLTVGRMGGAWVGGGVGDGVGEGVGDAVGEGVGDADGEAVGDAVGEGVGDTVGAGVAVSSKAFLSSAARKASSLLACGLLSCPDRSCWSISLRISSTAALSEDGSLSLAAVTTAAVRSRSLSAEANSAPHPLRRLAASSNATRRLTAARFSRADGADR